MVTDAVRAADDALTDLASGFHLVLDLTPVDLDERWADWKARRVDPTFRYRTPSVDPDAVRRRVDEIDLDAVEHPAIRRLLTRRARELQLQCDLLTRRDGPGFLEASVRLLGGCDDRLLALARTVLDRLPPGRGAADTVHPAEFARRAAAEVRRYKAQVPGFQGTISIRADVPSLMVVQRELIVGTDAVVPRHRVEALVHHEVGTHLLTAETGGRQPLRLLEQGTAGFEETQEALAVLAEHLVGGLDADRLRVLAGRAVAVRLLQDGAGFIDIVDDLEGAGFAPREAWTVTARVLRGGGYTKDVIYLRGLDALASHLEHHPLASLLVGKLSLTDRPDVDVLLDEGVLSPAAVRPHWLDVPGAADRLARLRSDPAPVTEWLDVAPSP